MDDEFVALRSAYYTGNYAGVEKEAKNLSGLSKKKSSIRDSYLCRAYIAQKKFKLATKLCGSKVTPPIVACKQLSIYKQASSSEEKELVLDEITSYLEEETMIDDDTFCIIASQIYLNEFKYKESLKLVINNDNNNLEKLLLQIEIYLKISRPDLALKSLKKMEEIEDDDTLTIIGRIWICLFVGGKIKTNEAIERIDDLVSANDETVLLYNMSITANMHLKKYNDAWKLCKKARDLSRNNKLDIPSSTLINSIICLQNLNKGNEILPKLFAELKKVAPEHQFIKKIEEKEKLFDKFAKEFKV